MSHAAAKSGWVAIPVELLELAERELTPEQERLLWRLARSANWQPSVAPILNRAVRQRTVALDVGELLVSIESLADEHRMSVDQVRRALRRFKDLGIVSVRPATPPAEGTATRAATPPSVLRFEKWREILWPPKQPPPEPATKTASPTARILPVVPALPGRAKNGSPSPAARPPPQKRHEKSQRSADPRFKPTERMFGMVFSELRGGKAFHFGGGRSGKALREFLEQEPNVTVGEIEKRWRLALMLPKYPGCSEVPQFFSLWNALDDDRQRDAPAATSSRAHMTAEETRKMLDGKERPWHEARASTDWSSRSWLWERWPDEYPRPDEPGWGEDLERASRAEDADEGEEPRRLAAP